MSFEHLHAGHCESGVTAALLRHRGLAISEPMLFGIGSGIFFAHFSFSRVMGQPLTTFRSFPGAIFKKACKRLGVGIERATFRDRRAGASALDAALVKGTPVGLQVNIYWLPYIPGPMRVHFNGHNLIVLEKTGDTYLISDPVMEEVHECPESALVRARFSGTNALLGSGLMYYPTHIDPEPDLRRATEQGLAEVCTRMRRIPFILPWFGVRGVRHLAGQLEAWPRRLGEEDAREWLAGLVRMQEEIGTGGAGFRYLFAAFLQEAGELLSWSALSAMSDQATDLGDQWRRFALHASRRARGKPDKEWSELAELLLALAEAEDRLFADLDAVRVAGAPQLTG